MAPAVSGRCIVRVERKAWGSLRQRQCMQPAAQLIPAAAAPSRRETFNFMHQRDWVEGYPHARLDVISGLMCEVISRRDSPAPSPAGVASPHDPGPGENKEANKRHILSAQCFSLPCSRFPEAAPALRPGAQTAIDRWLCCVPNL